MIKCDYIAITQNCRNKIVWKNFSKRYLALFRKKKKERIIRLLHYGIQTLYVTCDTDFIDIY